PSDIRMPRFLSPEQLVKRTEGDPRITGISISFNEPTLSLEYALDVFRLCKPETYCMFVTNGYLSPAALNLLIEAGLTGMSITIKGDSEATKKYCKTNVEKVWETIKIANREGVHVEVICLVIPTVNDSIDFFKQVSSRLASLDQNIPLHFTRFFPAYQFTEVEPTPIATLEKAHQIARSEGLNFVYLGNVFGHSLENTYCPNCETLLIKRTGYQLKKIIDLETCRCPSCRTKILFRLE
ncbi:MAG: radical SAM protein, partial [Candidatus Hodarchaeota archaeon]